MKGPHLKQQGVSIIEVIIAIGIISVILVAIGFSVTGYVNARTELLHNTRAVYLAEEGYEILRAIRDDNWNTLDGLTIGDTYYLAVATTTIDTSNTVPEVIDGLYYRSFKLTEVYRDGDDDITDSPGTVDTGILEVTVSVFGPTGTTSMKGLLSNLHVI